MQDNKTGETKPFNPVTVVVETINEMVEAQHARLYPNGCPNRCEACVRRIYEEAMARS